MAGSCGLTLRNLQSRFQTAFGISPQDFLIKTRAVVAMRLLNEASLTAAEIVNKSGFVGANSFAEHFKRRTGMAPNRVSSEAGKIGTVVRS